MNQEPIKIIDVIYHKSKDFLQIFHVLNRMPFLLYEKRGNWLIGEDSGFFNFYHHGLPWGRFKAFAGRKFDILMKDGSIIKADGQWWDATPDDYRGLLVQVGIGTIEKLNKCNIFCCMSADPEVLKTDIEPSNNYHKYDSKHPDYGKQRIISKWE